MKNERRGGVTASEAFERHGPSRLEAGATKWTPIMKNKELDAKSLWIQVEDVLVPQLRLAVIDHVVYSHLLRHSRLEGKLRLRFSIQWLARAVRVSGGPAREAVRWLRSTPTSPRRRRSPVRCRVAAVPQLSRLPA